MDPTDVSGRVHLPRGEFVAIASATLRVRPAAFRRLEIARVFKSMTVRLCPHMTLRWRGELFAFAKALIDLVVIAASNERDLGLAGRAPIYGQTGTQVPPLGDAYARAESRRPMRLQQWSALS